ncbi:MAG: hypothetical protein R3F53_00580 [Gammaproteobacteria bacterium]
MFDYSSSVFNPVLKLVITFGYAIVVYLYYRCLKEYKGSETGTALKVLLWMGIFGFLGALTRYLGHGTDLGFTKELSLKWLQSLFYIVQAVFFIYAAGYFLKASRS